ncbi:histone deacetylase complex subunit SAP130-A-like isoform X1 [Periplaneta americana]|uniref:histone deacetylase complex subunit SAP130-A-like isoform X1 n=1 Tax=Periplaneta americana TaxID=6978 RepID=UPI0037E72E57
MSSIGNSGGDREANQERHPVDLAAKATLKTPVDSTRTTSIQAASQLRSIGTTAGHPAARVQSSGIQTIVTCSSTTSQVSHVGSGSQMSLKQVSVQRSALPVCTASASAHSGTVASTRPSIVPATSPLPHQTNSATSATHVSTTYHVPRGAAAVANIAAPRSAVATPIVRATANLQSTASTQHTNSFTSGLRGLGPSTLLPRAPSPAAQSATWLSVSSPSAATTAVPKCVSPGPMLTSPRAPSITTIQQYTQGRSSSMTVTARPLTPQGSRLQSESPRPQLIHASSQKPIAATQTGAQLHIADKSYFKPSVSVQSSLGVSIARTQASPLTYSNPLTSTAAHFPVTSGAGQGPTTLIAAQPHPLTLSQGMTTTGNGQGSTTVLTAPARLTLSSIPGTSLPTQGAVLTATTTQRPGPASNTAVLAAPARLAVSTANQVAPGTARVTVAATGSSQTVSLTTTASTAGQGTIIASSARITTLPSSVLASGQGTATLLTGPTRLTMTSSIPVASQNAVLSGQTRLQAVSSTVPTAIAASSSQGAVLATPTRIAVPAANQPVQQSAGVLSTQTRLTVSASSAVASNSGQSALITAPARLTVSSNSSITPSAGHQGTTVLAAPARLTVTSGVPSSGLPPAGVVSLHPVVVSNTNQSLPLKPSTHNQLGTSSNRSVTAHQSLGPKVITQPAHGPPIQITQVPVSSVSGKLPQSLHNVTPLQTAIAITTGATRTVAYTATTTVTTCVSGIRPVTVATTSTIPVAKVFPQAVGMGREQIGTNSVSEVTLPVHAIQTPQTGQQQPQQTIVATQQAISQATSVYIQTSHRTSPAPTSTQASVDRSNTTLPTYTLPTTYYYETSSGYQVAGVGSSLVARPYNPGSPYAVQTTTTPALRPGVTTHQVHGIVTGTQPVRFNPVMVVDPSRTSMPVHSSFVTEGTLVQAEGSVLGQSNQIQPTSKPNASPRPSILRKRDNEGSPMKAQKNLAPVLAALSSGAPVSPPSPRRPDSRGNGGNSSGGSTTISATSSPGLGEAGDDSLPPIKQEPVEEGERPPVEMSPRKKPRKQQLTGNELHEPKFSEDEMEFISEEKIKKEVKEVSEEYEEKIYIPKRPNISLINSYRHTWKSRHNHYLRYSDVKPKDERRPTVTDLANQKQVLQKLNGWKIYHLSTQMEDLSDLEMQVFEKLTAMLKVMEKKTGKELDKDVNRVNELIKGNIQRSKVIKDQMQEAKSQVMKIFDHKSHVTDIISRCANKRSLKKRDKS